MNNTVIINEDFADSVAAARADKTSDIVSSSYEKQVKARVVSLMREKGHNTFANVFDEFEFKVTNSVLIKGNYCPIDTAAMFASYGFVAINPGFMENEQTFNQLDMILRHELMHSLMKHMNRAYRYLRRKIKDKKELDYYFNSATIHECENMAADWDLSRSYTKEDIEIVQHLRLNGKIAKGLVLESDHPEWMDLSMEEIFEKLEKIHEDEVKKNLEDLKHPLTINIKKAAPRSKAYIDTWNKVMQKYGGLDTPDSKIAILLADLASGKDIAL